MPDTFNPPPCPLCRKRASPQHRPFCSQGCKDRDLINWLSEAYSVPARDEEQEDAETGLDSAPLP